MNDAVTFHHVSFAYPRTPVLQDVSFRLPSTSVSVLFGPSGSGKTTCLRLLAGLAFPTTGGITLFGENAASIPPHQRGIGFCFQEPVLWPSVTVYNHIRLCLTTRDQEEDQIQYLLQTYRLEHVARQYPSQLSGGEKKRLDFARAMAVKPKLLLLDEPLSGFEEPLRDELILTIEQCRNAGGTVAAVTHQKDELFALAEHVVILQNGSVVNQGSPQALYHQPNNRITAELMGLSNVFPVSIDGGVMRTPFGSLRTSSNQQRTGLAACSVHDLVPVEPAHHDSGCALVKACSFINGRYRITVVINRHRYRFMHPSRLEKDAVVYLQLNRDPVLIHETVAS